MPDYPTAVQDGITFAVFDGTVYARGSHGEMYKVDLGGPERPAHCDCAAFAHRGKDKDGKPTGYQCKHLLAGVKLAAQATDLTIKNLLAQGREVPTA